LRPLLGEQAETAPKALKPDNATKVRLHKVLSSRQLLAKVRLFTRSMAHMQNAHRFRRFIHIIENPICAEDYLAQGRPNYFEALPKPRI